MFSRTYRHSFQLSVGSEGFKPDSSSGTLFFSNMQILGQNGIVILELSAHTHRCFPQHPWSLNSRYKDYNPPGLSNEDAREDERDKKVNLY